MELTEEYYLDAFGVQDKRESPPAEDTDGDEVPENPGETPEDVREPETEDDSEPETGTETEGQADEKPKQSRGKNAKYAAARREAEAERDRVIAERDQAIAEAVKKARAEARDELLAEIKLDDPYKKQPITTDAELKEYQAAHAQKQHEKLLRDTGQTEEQYQAMVDNLPEVQEAKRKAAEAERVLEERRKSEMKAWVESEMAEVAKYDPAIRTADDLAKDPKYEAILSYVEKGLSISEAYKLTHIDDLSQRRGRQQAINQAGKAHMVGTKARGDGGYEVPGDELEWYHRLMPGATAEQIAQHYNKMVQN